MKRHRAARPSVAQWISRHWMWVMALVGALLYMPLSGMSGDHKSQKHHLDVLTETLGMVQKQSVEPPTPKQMTHATIQGMLHTLDPHSNYLDEQEYRSLREDQRGTFFGIGAMISQQLDGIMVVRTVRGGPSEKAGILAGDYIKEIDGKSTDGWTTTQAVQKLHGEKGAVVEVAIQRAGFVQPIKFAITRAEIPSNTIYYSFMVNQDTGWITVKDFGETTSSEFEKSLATLKSQGMKSLILDLRGNPGGLVDAAVGICRQLLGPDEVIVTQKGRGGVLVSETRTPKDNKPEQFPIVVLVNRGSASASEIVSGAVQDHDRGLVVGQTSWGKGLVQVMLTIGRNRGLTLTTARYYTPSGRCIQRDYQHGLDDYLSPDEENQATPPTTKGPEYKTFLGRTVYGGGGITPDYLVVPEKYGNVVTNLAYLYSAFMKYAIVEKNQNGVKPLQLPDDAMMDRFYKWTQAQKPAIPITAGEWTDPKNQKEMREVLGKEMQNLVPDPNDTQRFFCDKDPQILKALEKMPEAAALLKKRLEAKEAQKVSKK